MRAIRRAVVIGNGFAGAENQCIGLVRALGLSHRHTLYRVMRPKGVFNEWFHWLPVTLHRILDHVLKRFRGNSTIHLPDEIKGRSFALDADAKRIATMASETFEKYNLICLLDNLSPDGPLLVVASGRDTIPIATSIKRLAPEIVFVVQIQHPRSNLDRFDLVITPRHDYYPLTPQAQKQVPWFLRRLITPSKPPGRNVVLTVGALHQADSAALRSAYSTWRDEFGPLPRPLVVVNIGGPTRHCRYGEDLAKQLVVFLQNVLPSCGSLRISFSRRTPKKVSELLIRELASNQKVHIWDGKDPNPHTGHLAWADALIVTADSVSMLSEACTTGKPVYVIGAERCTWKFSDFHKSLHERGVVRPFTGKENMSERWSYRPLNDNAEGAAKVVEALAERGWRLQL